MSEKTSADANLLRTQLRLGEMLVDYGQQRDAKRFVRAMRRFFRGTTLNKKSVLDIGGGIGACSFFAATLGATDVLCFEPHADGSEGIPPEGFDAIRRKMGLTQVKLIEAEFSPRHLEREFDIVVLHNVVNHLNEAACESLHRSEAAESAYRRIFKELAAVMSASGKIILSDCARHNLWGDLRIRNPITPTIEWKKHQQPRRWADLLTSSGLTVDEIDWTFPARLGDSWRPLLGNRVAAYLTNSHFRLTASRSQTLR